MSAIGGFTFLGKHIKNDKKDILLLDVDRDALPDMSNLLAKRTVSVTVGVYGKSAIERRQKTRALLQDWIGQEGALSFDDDPGIYFKAKLVDKSPVDSEMNLSLIQLMFEASRNSYGTDERTVSGTTGALTTITKGNTKIDTVITLNSNCTVSCNGKSFTITGLSEPIIIDSDRMVVYKIVSGKEVSMYQCFKGDFITLAPGATNTITISGSTQFNLKYRDTYIV